MQYCSLARSLKVQTKSKVQDASQMLTPALNGSIVMCICDHFLLVTRDLSPGLQNPSSPCTRPSFQLGWSQQATLMALSTTAFVSSTLSAMARGVGVEECSNGNDDVNEDAETALKVVGLLVTQERSNNENC